MEWYEGFYEGFLGGDAFVLTAVMMMILAALPVIFIIRKVIKVLNRS